MEGANIEISRGNSSISCLGRDSKIRIALASFRAFPQKRSSDLSCVLFDLNLRYTMEVSISIENRIGSVVGSIIYTKSVCCIQARAISYQRAPFNSCNANPIVA